MTASAGYADRHAADVPWPPWLEDLSDGQRVDAIVRAVSACSGAGELHDQDGQQHCTVSVARLLLRKLLLPEHADTALNPCSRCNGSGSEPGVSSGADLIAAERRRQVTEEGCTPEHDAKHWRGDMAKAAVVYALSSVYPPGPDGEPKWTISGYWPRRWKFKPADPVRMLVKAGALIAAEIDRLRVAAAGAPPAEPQPDVSAEE